ncbi:MAG TPA: NAD(P)-binding domain-containing protein [Candidatus Limnocylindria bacterium]|nr:NAD(P)-binding domain-containing protein [Candidatus Limnocylindria bacterium]
MSAERPFPPGDYPAVVVGSGPGGLQLSYSLRRLGIEHAVISADPAAGGMFRRWPFFQRLLSWTKPYVRFDRSSREFERYDWNSLLADEPDRRGLMTEVMDGSSNYPSRPEMQRSLERFAERTGVAVRYGCTWTSTRREEGGGFVLATTDGEYRCRVPVFAVGVAEPWTPPTPGIEHAAHYADTRPAETYAGKRIFIIGKENSAFELATGFLPWAASLVLASPSPAKLSILTRSLVGVRARYVQPYEDHVIGGGGVTILNASIESIDRAGEVLRVRTRRTDGPGELAFEVDDVIAATGFTSPIRDLPALGVATVGRNALPAQTAFWESASAPGVYFAGTIHQASPGLRKHGMPSNSGGVNGHRYNGRILARHIARTHFGVEAPVRPLRGGDVIPFLLYEVTHGPELWHQKAYLARVVRSDPKAGLVDDGVWPLMHFLDAGGPDAVAATVEENAAGDIYPSLYVRRGGDVREVVLPPNPLLDFRTAENERALADALAPLIAGA